MSREILYRVVAQVETTEKDSAGNEWRGMRQVPTFYLYSAMQGITSVEHAQIIARQTIDPTNKLTVHMIVQDSELTVTR